VSALVVIGDALLDRDLDGTVTRMCPDAPVPVVDERSLRARPGGGGLAAALSACDGREVTLISAVGDDESGRKLARLLADQGVELIDMGLDGPTPEKVRVRSAGRSLLRVDRGGAPARIRGGLAAGARAAIGWADAVLVADYGRGVAAHPAIRGALEAVVGERPVVWDPHPRGPEPVAGATLVTPNQAEAAAFSPRLPDAALDAASDAAAASALALVDRWQAAAVCVTCAEHGALLARAGTVTTVPAAAAAGGDPCGAGDRFSSAVAGALADGADIEDAVRTAVAAATDFVARGGAAAIGVLARRRRARRSAAGRPHAVPAATGAEDDDGREPTRATAAERGAGDGGLAWVQRLRRAGGTVVATGGCFDLLHAGHLHTLEAARALGDCLVVCLNSDSSVRRLKGPSRPLVAEGDRAGVIGALRCVDAVVVFDEDTPADALERVRPDVWVKGGDYDPQELPEREVVERFGGRVCVLPYLHGHSTTAMLKAAADRAG